MSDAQQVDLVVIGLGPGGEALATAVADAGLAVVAVDRHLVGGECPYYGCVPTKMMVRGSDLVAETGRAAGTVGDVTLLSSWAPVAERVAVQATDHWDDRVAVERLQGHGATVLHGTARLDGVRRVVVTPTDGSDPVTYEASRGVVLNPGTRPATPPVEGLADTPFWTNRDAVQVTELPGSLVVVGGGPIGCELAQVFSRFGVRVTVVQHGDRHPPRQRARGGRPAHRRVRAGGDPGRHRLGPHQGVVRRRTVRPHPRLRRAADRRQGAGGRRPDPEPRRHRPRDRRPRPRRSHGAGGRPDARRRRARQVALGDRRRDRPRRLHAHVDVPERHRPPRHPRRGRSAGGVPRGPARHLHRPRGGRRRDDRAAGQGRRPQRADRDHQARGVDPRLHARCPVRAG